MYCATVLYIRHGTGQIFSHREQFWMYGSVMEFVSNRTAYLELRATEMGRYWCWHKGVSFIVTLRTGVLRDVTVDAGFGTFSMDQSPS